MKVFAVIMRGVRAKPDALPKWEYLATPVEILAGGEFDVPMEAWVWGGRVPAAVFPLDLADRIARLATNEVTHVYPGICSQEAPHPAAHVEGHPVKAPAPSPAKPAPRRAAIPAKLQHESGDWHAKATNCGVE